MNLLLVAPDQRQIASQLLDPVDVLRFRMLRSKQLSLFDQVVNVDIGEFRLSRTTKIEQISHRLVQPADLFPNLRHDFAARVIFRIVICQNVDSATDPGQRILDLVRQPGRHFADRSEPLGPRHLLVVTLLQLALRLFQVVDHRVKTMHQLTDFIPGPIRHPHRQITGLDLGHPVTQLAQRLAQQASHDQGKTSCQHHQVNQGRNDKGFTGCAQLTIHLVERKIEVEDTDHLVSRFMAFDTAAYRLNRHLNRDHPGTISRRVKTFDLFLLKKIKILCRNPGSQLFRPGGPQNDPFRAEDLYRQQLFAVANLFQDCLNVVLVAGAHGMKNRALKGIQQQLGVLPADVDQELLLALQMVHGEGTDTEDQQQHIQQDDTADQTIKQSGSPQK